MVCFMNQSSWGARGGGWTEAESGVSWTSLGALLGVQTEAELTKRNHLSGICKMQFIFKTRLTVAG